MRVSDLRIGVKLGAGFLAVVLFTTLLGVMALVQMSRIHQGADQIATNLLPSVAQTGELRVLLNRMRRSEAGVVTSRSVAATACSDCVHAAWRASSWAARCSMDCSSRSAWRG